MKVTFIIIFFAFFSNGLTAQEYAEFSTDTTRFRRFYKNKKTNLPEYISNQEWYINGQKMNYGSGKIKVKVNPNTLDTILYKGYRRKKFDTIICNIAEAKKYKFYYNECCGAFNIKDESTNSFIIGKINYRLKSKTPSKTYLDTLGESGIIVSTKKDNTLYTKCRSAMSPNIYNISFREIEYCSNDQNCTEGICLQKENQKEPQMNFSFHTIDVKMKFLFMPLTSDPVDITFDPKTNQVVIF